MKIKNKNIIIIVAIIAAITLSGFGIGWFAGKTYDPANTYEAPVIVTEIDESTGWVTLVDWAGEAWCIRGNDYEINQLVIAEFNDNNSPDYIYDDMIVNIRCANASE